MRDIKAAIKNGKKVIGTFVWDFGVPFLPRILAGAGFDYIVIDCEHGYFSYETIANMISNARLSNISVFVRIVQISRDHIQHVWDMGADGILVPFVETAEQAKEIVRLSKFAPQGQRGISFNRGFTDYDYNADKKQALRDANEKGVILVQAETRKAVENIDEIIAVDGIDGILVGPGDLSNDMGMLGQFTNPDFDAAVTRVLTKTKQAGKIVASYLPNYDMLKKQLDLGLEVILWGNESAILYNASKEITTRIREMTAPNK
jgi:2-dehydro-3-deoxyglucarate aldolase/4-hydroxy-2-oxoheptanedioate aldolase